MKIRHLLGCGLAASARLLSAQDPYVMQGTSLPSGTALPQAPYAQQQTAYPDNTGYGDAYLGPASVGSSEPLYYYDDQERWKHGYLQAMPFYGGHNAFLPYNYHAVFAQSQTAAGWGMSPALPYSQQFWHRYENMTDLSRGHHTPLQPYIPPVQEWDHYPTPIRPSTALPPGSNGPVQAAPLVPNGRYREALVLPAAGQAPQPAYPPVRR